MTNFLHKLSRILLLILSFCCVQQSVSAQSKKASRYQWQYDLKRAERQLQKSDASNSTSESLLRYAEVLFYQNKVNEAYPLYRKADSLGLVTTLDQQRNYVYSAIRTQGFSPYAAKSNYFQLMAGTYAVKKFNVNTPQEDFAPFVWNDKVFVTSSRPTANNKRQQKYVLTRFPFLDVFAFNQQGEKNEVDFLPKLLNSVYHDGPLALSPDTNLLFLTRNYDMPDKNGTHHLYITVFKRDGKSWSSPERLHFCEPTFTVQHPFYDAANRKLYFSSNMPGGRGGFDLYTITWDGSEWSSPVNAGSAINTIYDEIFPSLNPKGQLLYATNHIESLGGLDLVLFENGQRKLLPEPINSVYDDFAMSFTAEKSGYFTSNRGNSAFDDDIWQFDWVVPAKPKQYLLTVIDDESKQALTGVEVVYNLTNQQQSLSSLVSTDKLELNIPSGNDSVTIASVGDKAGQNIKQVLYEYQGDTVVLIKVFIVPEPKSVVPGALLTAVYFHNDRPKVQDITPKADYSASFALFADSLTTYYAHSVDKREALTVFWEQEVKQGWESLQAMQKAIATHLASGGSVDLAFSGYCSPLHTDDYNVQLAKRRVQVVQRYLLGNKLLSSQVAVSVNYFGEAKANPKVSDELASTPLSVYSIAASLERKVEVKVTFK